MSAIMECFAQLALRILVAGPWITRVFQRFPTFFEQPEKPSSTQYLLNWFELNLRNCFELNLRICFELNLRSCLQKENWNVSTCLCLYHLHQHISTLHHSIVAYCTTIVYNHCVPLLCTFTLVFHYWTALVSDSVPTCRPTNQQWDRKRFTFEQRCGRVRIRSDKNRLQKIHSRRIIIRTKVQVILSVSNLTITFQNIKIFISEIILCCSTSPSATFKVVEQKDIGQLLNIQILNI